MATSRAALLVFAVLACLLVGAQAQKSFAPPKTATVDISEVFEKYEKKRDRQLVLTEDAKTVDKRLKDLERKLKDIEAEIRLMQEGEAKSAKNLERLKFQYELRELERKEVKRLSDQQTKFLEEIRAEINKAIAEYAEAYNLDLVIEKTVTAEPTRKTPGFRWPIVHYVKPELDITQQLVDRLNRKYKAP